MVNKLLEELYGEYVALLRQLNKKQGKLIERLSEELKAAKDNEEYFSRLFRESQSLLEKTRTDMAAQNKVIQKLAQEKLALKAQEKPALKAQITEEATARLAAIKKEMAEQNQVIQGLAREKFERNRENEGFVVRHDAIFGAEVKDVQ